MKKNCLDVVGVRLPNNFLTQVDGFAEKRQISRTSVLRDSAMLGFGLLNAGVSPDIRRVLTLLENINLGMTLMVEERDPEHVDKLLDIAMENVDEHHG